MAPRDTKIVGQRACMAVYEHRPEAVIRVLLTEDARPIFRALLRRCAEDRKPYRVVSREELERFSGSRHHEGICVVAIERTVRPIENLVTQPGPLLFVALSGVGNPHNVGTILRTAAHFGATGALVEGPTSRLSSAAYRTAEGGAESLAIVHTTDLTETLQTCRRYDMSIYATSSHEGTSLYATPLPARLVLVFGSERHGVPTALLKTCDGCYSIPGTEAVESLNVASSAAVLMAEYWRLHRSGVEAPPLA